MLSIGYLIILDGHSIKNISFEMSIFELLRLENCTKVVPYTPWDPPPNHMAK